MNTLGKTQFESMSAGGLELVPRTGISIPVRFVRSVWGGEEVALPNGNGQHSGHFSDPTRC